MALCLFLVMQPAFPEYEDLTYFELLFPDPAFEKRQLEDMASGGQGKCQGLESNISAAMLFLATNFFKQVSPSTSSISSPNPQAPVFRC